VDHFGGVVPAEIGELGMVAEAFVEGGILRGEVGS